MTKEKRIHIRIDEEDEKRIEELAERLRRTKSDAVRIAIENQLKILREKKGDGRLYEG